MKIKLSKIRAYFLLIVVFLVFLPSLTISSQSVSPQVVTPPSLPGTWNLSFSDEFNGSTLDLSKWEPSWFNGTSISPPANNLEAGCYDPANISESSGNLNIAAVTSTNPNCKLKDGTQAFYAGGLINSRNSFTFNYGYMEARIYLPGSESNIFNWPAFWSTTTGSWPQNGEIDVIEGLSAHQPCWHYHYQDSSGVAQAPGGCVTQTTPWGWHTYSALWEPTKITFYYDGQVAGTQTTGVSNANNQYIIFTNALNTAYGINVPATMLIDYIRVWQNSTLLNKPIGCNGDYDKNGTVNISDFSTFAQNYKKAGLVCSLDITGNNCLLDISDFAEFAKVYKVSNACI